MDMITRQSAMDDLHTQFAANLPDDLSYPKTDLPMQHLEAVFWCPDYVITMMKSGLASTRIWHKHYPPENDFACEPVIFWRIVLSKQKTAEAFYQLEAGGFTPKVRH
jgi:hypothetical protein